jgi:adenosylcobinamide kinase/adenosylcobinamide-phosphate guanylyltransferase
MTRPDLTFVLGGARSGKSRYAEQLAQRRAADLALPVTYVATARDAGDAEFAARIAHHRARRPREWGLVEAGVDLAGAVADADASGACILVDCLTLWLAGVLCPAEGPADADADADADVNASASADVNASAGAGDAEADGVTARIDALEAALARVQGPVIVVSNEIGLGVVPMGAVTRRYVDELGRLNQRIAALAREVTLMVAGLPMTIKGGGDR